MNRLHMKEITSHTYPTLLAWRRAARLNQRDAAAVLGLTQSHYSKIERRTHALPGTRAKVVMKKTGVPLEVLVLTAA